MGDVLPLPNPGEVFVDVRGPDRTMRVSYHADRGIVVVSLWTNGLCRGSFRLAEADADRLVAMLSTVQATAVGDDAAPVVEAGAVVEAGTVRTAGTAEPAEAEPATDAGPVAPVEERLLSA